MSGQTSWQIYAEGSTCSGFYPSTFVNSRFFPKDWVFLLFAKSVNLNLQIAGKWISCTLFDFKAYVVHFWYRPFSLWTLWFGDKVHKISSTNWCIKVCNTHPRLRYWWVILICFVTRHGRVSRSCLV